MTRDTPRTVLAGRYELMESVGRGGMARVWKAKMRGAAGFSRLVAVKRMLLDIARDPETVALFVEEARVGAHLSHPNIVQVLDFGADETGTYYLVLEWVDGLDFLDYMRSYHQTRHHVPWQAVAAIGYQALQGLAAAHERLDETGQPKPVIHRDVTPSNILVGENGVVKLADFGLAKAMDRLTTTLPNIIKGKMAYTAPELARGSKASVRSDLFSFGVTCWESLAGRQLFKGDTALEVIRAIKTWDIPKLAELRPDIPLPFVNLVEKSMAKDPAARFVSAREMGRALSAVVHAMEDPVDEARLGYSVKCGRQRLGRAAEEMERAATEIEASALVSSHSVEVAFEESPASRRTRVPQGDDLSSRPRNFSGTATSIPSCVLPSC